jgi:hypothetical protein
MGEAERRLERTDYAAESSGKGADNWDPKTGITSFTNMNEAAQTPIVLCPTARRAQERTTSTFH